MGDVVDRGGLVEETMEKPPKAPKQQMEIPAWEVGHGIDGSGSGHSASPTGLSQPAKGPESPTISMAFPASPESPAASAERGGLAEDLDCRVCFEPYTPCRLPKILACQHVFCSVCLKLLLQNQGGSWKVFCPICRKATIVFGGLICSLNTKEELRLGATVDPEGEGAGFPDPRRGMEPAWRTSLAQQEDGNSGNRVAARRLLFLLLLLVLLVLLVLPFVDSGLLKWALSIAMVWGVAMAAMLGWNPQRRCCCLDIPFPVWRKTDSHATPVA